MTTTYTTKTDDLATLLRMWRAAADISLDELVGRIAQLLPPSQAPKRETLRRYEKGLFPVAGPNEVVLAAYAIACGQRIGELPDEVRTDVELVAQLLRKSCFSLSTLAAA